jgi:hypothetical protein
MQYIGETSRPIRQRIYEHLYSITKNDTKPTPVSRHFHQAHHSPNDLSFTIIEIVIFSNLTMTLMPFAKEESSSGYGL